MNRFKISFDNSGISRSPYMNNIAQPTASIPAPVQAPRSVALNSPMIARVYKAKPGCSACGKKVS
jgi:hypothetical protein